MLFRSGSDGALALGEYRLTGKDQSGAPLEVVGRWTAVYVREGGKIESPDDLGVPKSAASKGLAVQAYTTD